MIGQILNRDVIEAQLTPLAEKLRALAAGRLERPPPGASLTDRDFEDAAALLEQAAVEPPEKPDNGEHPAGRRATVAPIEDYA